VAKLPKVDAIRRCIRRQLQEQARDPIPMDFNLSHEYTVIEEEKSLRWPSRWW